MSESPQQPVLRRALAAFLASAGRRRTVETGGLEARVRAELGPGYLEAGGYPALAALVTEEAAAGRLAPVRARGTNGRSPPLWLAYRLPPPAPAEPAPLARAVLHPRIDLARARVRPPALAERVLAVSRYLFAFPAPGDRPVVPRNEKSLEVFGDEKFLERNPAFLPSLGLSLADLHAYQTREPFFCTLFREPVRTGLVVENLSAYESVRAALRGDWRWGAPPDVLIYGEGKKILRSAESLAAYPELRRLAYFGDLDPVGVEILAGLRESEPRAAPDEALYRGLLAREALARPLDARADPETAVRAFAGTALAGAVTALFHRGLWLPQEALGLEALLPTARI